MDFRDAFFGGLWVVVFLVPIGVAGKVLLQLGIVWAAGLDAINSDDSALEDQLEPLYQHGNKMDNGFSGGWR